MPELKLKKSMKPRKGGRVVLKAAVKEAEKQQQAPAQDTTEEQEQEIGDDNVS